MENSFNYLVEWCQQRNFFLDITASSNRRLRYLFVSNATTTLTKNSIFITMRILDATIDTSKMIEQDPLFQQWMMNAVHFRAETENGRLDGQDIHLLSSYSQLEDATDYPSYDESSAYILYERIIQYLVKESGLSIAEATKELSMLLKQYEDNNDAEVAEWSSETKYDSATCEYLTDDQMQNHTEGLQLPLGSGWSVMDFQLGMVMSSIVFGWLVCRWWRRHGDKIGSISSCLSQRRQAAIIKELLDSEVDENKLKSTISLKGSPRQQKTKKNDRRNKKQNTRLLTPSGASKAILESKTTTGKVRSKGTGNMREFYLLREQDNNTVRNETTESQDLYSLNFGQNQDETKEEIIYSPRRHESTKETCLNHGDDNHQCCQCDVCAVERELFRLIIEKSLGEGGGCTFSVDCGGRTIEYVVNGHDDDNDIINEHREHNFNQDDITLAQNHKNDGLIQQDSCVSAGIPCLPNFLPDYKSLPGSGSSW